MDRTRARSILGGLGLVLVFISVISGVLSSGYGMSVSGVLLRVGVAFFTLGIATVTARSITVRYAFGASMATIAIMFVLGGAVMYYDLVVMPSGYGTPLTAGLLVATQAELTLPLTPVPLGYLAGVLYRRNRNVTAIGLLVATAIVGYSGTTWMMLFRGSAPGFTQMAVSILTLAAVGFALVPLVLMVHLSAENVHSGSSQHAS